MATLSARGCHKVASATNIRYVQNGEPETWFHCKTVLALRSDGKVLERRDFKRPDARGWAHGTSYTIRGSLKPKDGVSSLERFERYCAARDFTLD